MSNKTNISLFFIKPPEAKLSAIESFLKKRNYNVSIESDLKEALVQIIEKQPEFVFIALDHPNSKVASLNQIIDQSILTSIVHYVVSSGKEEVRKLNYGQYNQKLFPPISGPAIERLVLKILKEKERENRQGLKDLENQNRKEQLDKSQDDLIQIKSNAVKNLDSLNQPNSASAHENLNEKSNDILLQKSSIQKTKIQQHNQFLNKASKKKFSSEQKNSLQNKFETKIKSQLLDLLDTYYPDHSQKNSTNLMHLDQPERFAEMDQNNTQAFCLPVENQQWCGYLMAYSSVHLDYQLVEPLLKDWLSDLLLEEPSEDEKNPAIEMQIEPHRFKTSIQKYSELSEKFSLNQVEFDFGFIGVEPHEFKLNVVDDHDLIEIDLELIPVDYELNLSLHLHLPDNKKFLLYTPLNQKLSPLQKQRLIDKNIDKLFTPAEYAQEIRKLKTRKYLNELLDNFKRDTSA